MGELAPNKKAINVLKHKISFPVSSETLNTEQSESFLQTLKSSFAKQLFVR